MNIRIREIKSSDIPEILTIASESFSLPWSINSFIEESKNPNSFSKVAENENSIIGYVIFRVVLDEAELLSIAVKRYYRNRGIAKLLLQASLNELQERIKTCYLEVRISNKVAINLYKKIGFRNYGRRKNYYLMPQEDALLMKLDLQRDSNFDEYISSM